MSDRIWPKITTRNNEELPPKKVGEREIYPERTVRSIYYISLLSDLGKLPMQNDCAINSNPTSIFIFLHTIGVLIHDLLRSCAGAPAQLRGALKGGITFFAEVKSSMLMNYDHTHPLSHYLRIQSRKFVSNLVSARWMFEFERTHTSVRTCYSD